MSRWISDERPSSRPFVMSRAFRPAVEYGSIEYSAVTHPPVTFCSFIQRGTDSSTVAEQMTRVAPVHTSTEPVAFGAKSGVKEIGRSWSGVRPSLRFMPCHGASPLLAGASLPAPPARMDAGAVPRRDYHFPP
jgi:hypothetical protein